MKICTVITSKTISKALKDIQKAEEQDTNMLELRIDYLSDLSPEGLEKVINASSIPIIVTPRLATEGGNWVASEEERFAYIQQAIDLGVDFVDIEFKTLAKFRRELIENKKQTKIIISYHNFIETPAFNRLSLIFAEMMEMGADMSKIATMSTSIDDNFIIFDLIQKVQKEKQNIIALCMGRLGVISRLVGPMLGSYLTYASLAKDKQSAPGQLSCTELRRLEQTFVSKGD